MAPCLIYFYSTQLNSTQQDITDVRADTSYVRIYTAADIPMPYNVFMIQQMIYILV